MHRSIDGSRRTSLGSLLLSGWILTFVSYTDKAFTTPDSQQALMDLAEKNGRDLDGTPVIRSASDVDNLAQKGFVALRTRKLDGSQGFPWVV